MHRPVELVRVQAARVGRPVRAVSCAATRAAAAPLVTEGPFPEVKEFLAGYWIVELPDGAAVIRRAGFLCTVPGPGGRPLGMVIEVRRVLSGPPEELG
jgi:hypothetical protein